MGENKSSAIITLLVMFVLFLSLISIVFDITRELFFKIELVLLGLFLLAGISLTYNILKGENKWGGLIKFYSINWINLLVIYFLRFGIKEIILPILVTGLGFLVALIKKEDNENFEEAEDDELDLEGRPASKVLKKNFSPGKYIASKSGTKYHAPKCDWAKKIKKKNQVWYESKEDAAKDGKKACNCIE
ncbi:hypothetical protein GF361_05415 [Candidatus Woesearchaeota archaeon]|nr:hypothetical protein [Candidatus Woesearchaeota archaeon]